MVEAVVVAAAVQLQVVGAVAEEEALPGCLIDFYPYPHLFAKTRRLAKSKLY